ncbi:unnamed protein product [Lactuca saligna]|uniref:Uncharacterized protein n=1 Tax=Lactuca saligna TaxID=75948 RepID=A0AA35ZT83_LACSI|nr:unnamed protein product [Lactuca saligna]CAI9297933.1 unnamed protein product [Lactuca saligna]
MVIRVLYQNRGKGNRISELLLIKRRGFTNGEGEETTTGGVWREAKLVLDYVGPCRLYGEPVVAACVEAGCDYLDISGESEFMERMEVVYHEKAMEKVGFVAAPNRVEAYLSLESDKNIAIDVFTVDIYTQGE